MKRLTSILAISVIAVMSAGAARADIASTTYVDNKVSPVSTKANNNATAITALQSGKQDKSAMVDSTSENLGEANDTNYPTVAAVWTIATHALGEQVNNKLDKKFTGDANKSKAVITDANGAITTGTISSAMITDGTIVNADIADGAAIAQSKIAGLAASIADAKKAGTDANTALNAYKTSNDDAVAKKADSATMTTELNKKENTSNKVTAISSASTNDQYPSAKAVYDELAKKQNNITIDSALSSTSTNPVQNKVVNTALAGKLGKNENAVSATKATQDGNGNPIATTYATKTELGTKQDKLVASGENANISGSNGVTVTVGTDGKIAVSGSKSAIDAAIAKKADSATMTTELAKKADSATMTTELNKKENTSNKVTAISSASTNDQYPSAKAVYDELAKKQNNITIDSALSSTSTNPVQNKVVNTALAGKQATLSTAQLAAANSGITSAKVTTYEGYSAKITAAQNTANTAKTTAEAAIAAPAANTISTDGLYTLTMKVVDGTKTYAWEKIGR